MPVERMKWITREIVQANPNKLFLFGDNMLRRGLGGQAAEMRDEPNTLGIATKWAPTMLDDDFFAPGDFHDPNFKRRMETDFAIIRKVLALGVTVVLPEDGIGTGLAQLDKRAPNICRMIDNFLEDIGRG